MSLKNTTKNYGIMTKILHWLIAILILTLISLGWYITTINYYHPYYPQLFRLHKSLGIITFFFAVINLIWYFTNISPALPPQMKTWEIVAAKSTHLILLLLTILMPISGYFISTAAGEGIQVFNLFQIPALFAHGHPYENLAGKVHYWLGYSMAGLVAIHALAALKHEFWNKDNTLKRML